MREQKRGFNGNRNSVDTQKLDKEASTKMVLYIQFRDCLSHSHLKKVAVKQGTFADSIQFVGRDECGRKVVIRRRQSGGHLRSAGDSSMISRKKGLPGSKT